MAIFGGIQWKKQSEGHYDELRAAEILGMRKAALIAQDAMEPWSSVRAMLPHLEIQPPAVVSAVIAFIINREADKL